ncbi:bile salt-activated lipase-like, partial [Mya arenaria]|uniref:bile salt-activated lipase-like n=1 Tax=Mya arenaria TaxID=6604 RepID=UPI0022E2A6F7
MPCEIFEILVTIALLAPVHAFLFDDARLHVHTGVGEIAGYTVDLPFDGTVYTSRRFLGIPYAEPPLGDKRFRKPTMMTKLPSSPFKAYTHGPVCPQPLARSYGLNTSEDCLFLNIHTPMPTGRTTHSWPVMVFIHGGGFNMGFSNIYDGSVLSAMNHVIVVAINYRLGPLGFFSTHDQNAPGNYGLWDQHLALQWVKNNIGHFGGDPDTITLFGESAGGSSVVYQSLFAGNKGLIKRAIAQSGTIAGWAVDRFNSSFKGSMNFAHALGCNQSSSADMMICLRKKQSSDISSTAVSVQLPIFPSNNVNRSWIPVLDQDFVKTETIGLLSKLKSTNFISNFSTFTDIEFMIGANSNDGLVYFPNWLLFMNVTSDASGEYPVTIEQIKDTVVPRIAQIVLGEMPTQSVLDTIAFEYTPWADRTNTTLLQKTMIDICTDSLLYAPSLLTARGHQRGTKNTYMYKFSVAPPRNFMPPPPSLLGERVASHADELAFVFGFPVSGLI